MKPGWKTSEFWISSLTSALGLMSAIGGFIPGHWGILLSGISTGAYAVSRGIAKSGGA